MWFISFGLGVVGFQTVRNWWWWWAGALSPRSAYKTAAESKMGF